MEGLRAINRHDLAMVVMPLNTKKVEIVEDAADTEGITARENDEDGDENKDDGVGPEQVKLVVDGKAGKKKKGGKKEKESDNNKRAVPKLPSIKKK